ncbi:MAG TPA: hypothetical protein VKV06_09200, partial [Acidimicrobiales bacterium]|nr:hypothetical protein [Acidimicrobiales bacterium]
LDVDWGRLGLERDARSIVLPEVAGWQQPSKPSGTRLRIPAGQGALAVLGDFRPADPRERETR